MLISPPSSSPPILCCCPSRSQAHSLLPSSSFAATWNSDRNPTACSCGTELMHRNHRWRIGRVQSVSATWAAQATSPFVTQKKKPPRLSRSTHLLPCRHALSALFSLGSLTACA
uniref:Uncharacterized protein n=1 Tax=Setaria viridis TaxID=4556 RepID=A0A4U6VLA9_SETVI|nr:hypothetical protein SEVIR_3G315800v2 [Setaria viridis]